MVVAQDQEPPLWLKVFGGFSAICLAAFALTLLLPAGRLTSDLLTLLDDPAIAFTVVALLFARSRSGGAMRAAKHDSAGSSTAPRRRCSSRTMTAS